MPNAPVSRLIVPNVVQLGAPARSARPAPAGSVEAFNLTWQLQFELAWAYPRLCYALWSRLMALPLAPARPRDGEVSEGQIAADRAIDAAYR